MQHKFIQVFFLGNCELHEAVYANNTKREKSERLDTGYKKTERKIKQLDPEYKEAETTRETKTLKNKCVDSEYKETQAKAETETWKNKHPNPEYKEAKT